MKKANIDHDSLFKQLISTFFIEFLDLFLPDVALYIDRQSISFLPELVITDVTEGEQKKIDLLVKAKYQGKTTFFLIHIEAQSYWQKDFAKRMFIYFSRLLEKYNLPIYPVVIFSFDSPKRTQVSNYTLNFPDLNVLDFNFASIQLNRMNWRDFLTQHNPVAAALMSKMNIPASERPQVKAECLRLLTTLNLDPARMQLIAGFVNTYLRLNTKEKRVFEKTVDTMGLTEKEEVMEIVTHWEEEAALKKAEEIAADMLRESMPIELVAKITKLPLKKVQRLQKKVSKEV